jgi:hypothetical protein
VFCHSYCYKCSSRNGIKICAFAEQQFRSYTRSYMLSGVNPRQILHQILHAFQAVAQADPTHFQF